MQSDQVNACRDSQLPQYSSGSSSNWSRNEKRHLSNDFKSEKESYFKIQDLCKSGKNLLEACKKTGIGRTTFYQRRFIVELMETDEEAFASLVQKERRIKQLNKLCKEKLETSPFKTVYRNLKFDGKLLP